MFKFLRGISAFRSSWASFAKSAPIPIRFPWNVLSLSLTAAFFRIFVLSVYSERLRGSVLDSFCFCLIASKYDEHAQFRRIHTMFPNTGARQKALYESHTIIAFWIFRNVIKHKLQASGPVAKVFYFSSSYFNSAFRFIGLLWNRLKSP